MSNLDEAFLDDCLVCVLKKLPLDRRYLFERVCRKWQNLMPYSDIRSLHFTEFHWSESKTGQFTYEDGNLRISQQILKVYWLRQSLVALLERCGPFLTDLSFQTTKHRIRLNPEILEMVVQKAPKLTRLNLYNCIMTPECLHLLLQLPDLQYLNLAAVLVIDQENGNLVQTGPMVRQLLENVVQNHPSLLQMNLTGWKVVPEFQNANLAKLHLQASPLNDQDLQALVAQCPNLVSLGLNSCHQITDFSPIGSSLPKLEKLWLNFTVLSSEHLALICKGCPRLTQLRIDGCNRLQNFDCLRSLAHLQLLWAGPNPMLSDANLARLARFGRLNNVSLSGCNITDQGLRYLSSTCPTLRELCVAHTMVTDEGILCLLTNCPQLKLLNCQFTTTSDQAIAAMGAICRQLETLYLQSCPDVTDHGLRLLMVERWQRMRAGKLKRLTVMTGGDRGNPVSHELIREMKSVNVELLHRPPLLALPD